MRGGKAVAHGAREAWNWAFDEGAPQNRPVSLASTSGADAATETDPVETDLAAARADFASGDVKKAIAGYKAILGASPDEANQSSDEVVAMNQASGVACPFGLVNDPYPGRCKHYRDSNGDGICDYSVAGSGSNLQTDDNGSLGGLSRHRQGSGRP